MRWPLLLVLGVATAVCASPSPAEPNPERNNSVDLRPEFEKWGFKPRLQGGRPTCSVFTIAGALEFASARCQGHSTRLSVEYLNWAANQACGNSADGGFFSDLWKGFSQHGICAEGLFPYENTFNPKSEPSPAARDAARTALKLGLELHWLKEWNVQTGLKDSEFAGIRRTLEAGWPVCAGMRWPKHEKWDGEVLQMCAPDAVRDGHSVLLVGYREEAGQPGGGVFLFRNTSHGGRDGRLPFAYARAYINDALWISPQAPKAHGAASPE